MSRLAKDKHDRTALDVIYDLDSKTYKLVTIKYSLENDSSFIHSLETINATMAVALMKLNIINDKKVQNAVTFAKTKLVKESSSNDEDII